MDSLVRIVQGLVIHEFVASSFYGVTLPDQRLSESHIRPVERMLERLLALDDRPLSVARPPEKRLVGTCRHFVVLLLAALRSKRMPARCRVGFGAYFNPGFFEDHWVCEYWSVGQKRWMLADPQFDEVWRARLHIQHDILDVPRDHFLTASAAWSLCRMGKTDPSKFGIIKGNLRGPWFVASDLVRDVSALNQREMLPWDVWGSMPRPNTELDKEQLEWFDRVATLTRTPDEWFDELLRLYENDDRLRVPPKVFNAVLNRSEPSQ